jgi:hypothetical protein
MSSRKAGTAYRVVLGLSATVNADLGSDKSIVLAISPKGELAMLLKEESHLK